jgi:hypothetical protein
VDIPVGPVDKPVYSFVCGARMCSRVSGAACGNALLLLWREENSYLVYSGVSMANGSYSGMMPHHDGSVVSLPVSGRLDVVGVRNSTRAARTMPE